MSYTKIISYGNTVEIYELEHDLIRNHGGGRKGRKETTSDDNMAPSREDSLQEGDSPAPVGKRQDNARRASLAFRRIVSANLGRGSALPILVTLTYADNFTDLAGAYKHYSNFVCTLRRQFGREFKYVCVPEFQKRGAVHFHALFWGLPEEILLLEREDRTLAGIWGHGFLYFKRTDGAEQLALYLTKYMAKAFMDPRLKNQKCYTASRNVQRPRVEAGNFLANSVIPYLGLEDEPVVERTYGTKWFGEGRYRLFKLKNDKS